MIDHLDAEDFDALASELRSGMAIAAAWQWVEPVIGEDLSASSFANHLTGRCRCLSTVPLHGVRRG
jgi:hypothetical protein